MWRRRQIYEGTPKVLFEGPEPGTLVQYFKDNAADHEKRGTIIGKGVLNSRICEFLMLTLAAIGIPTQFRRPLDMRERPVREVEIIPLRGVVHNVPAGSLASSVSAANSASFAATTPCASSSPTRSARTICGFGTAAPRKNSTRIASGRTGNNLLKATRRWRRLEILPEGGPAGFMGPRAIR